MLIRRIAGSVRQFEQCHGGGGVVHCTEMLADYEKRDGGFKFFHDNIIEPGASIGEHMHTVDEEIYFIVEGSGRMVIDGQTWEVGPGDMCLTRRGHRHALTNTGVTAMRLLVICTQVGLDERAGGG